MGRTTRRNAFVALTAGALLSGADETPAEPVELSGGAWADRIPGGPALLMIPQRSVPMFSATVLVPAGSALETAETNGAAHYLEHLLFNGTTTRSREQIYAGADLLGAYNNASTQRERTVFQLLLPSEHWREGLELQADMILRSTLPAEMFEKEKGIILEELAKDRSGAGYEAERFTSGVLWGDAPRGMPVLGTEESIAAMDREAVERFYREHYRPESMTILLMGDFDPAAARAELALLYGGGQGAAPPLPPRPDFPARRRAHFRSFPGLGTIDIQVLLPLPPFSSPHTTAGKLLAGILDSGERSAVSRSLEAVLSAGATLDPGEPWSVLKIALEVPASADAPGAVHAILEHLSGAVESGFDADEVETARRKLISDEISLREKMHYYGLMQADVLGQGGPEAPDRLMKEAEGVDSTGLRQLLARTLEDGRVTAIVTGPDVGDRVEELPAVEIPAAPATAPFAKRGGDRIGLASPHAPALEARFSRTELEDGLTLILNTSPEGRMFSAHVLLRNRADWEAELDVPPGGADVLHRMMELGTQRWSRDELRGKLSRSGIQLKVTDLDWLPYDDYYFSAEFSYVRLECVDNAAPEAIAVLREILSSPRLDEETFAVAVEAAAARAQRDAGSPRATAGRLFYSGLGDRHPLARGPLGSPEEIRSMTLDDVKRLAGAYLSASNAILVISANARPETILQNLRQAPLFGQRAAHTLPEASPWQAAERSGRTEIVEEIGQEQSYLAVGSPLAVAPEDEAALEVAVAVLSERLSERLREAEGLAYSIGATARLHGPGPNVRMLGGTRPENLERLETGMRQVAQTLTTDPPGPEEIEGARNRAEGRARMRRLSRIGQAYAMVMAEFRGLDPEHLDRNLPALRAVTPDDVKQAAARYLRFEPSIAAIAR